MVERKLDVLNNAGKAPEIVEYWKKQGQPLPSFYHG
jgi:amino acid permease